MLIFVPTKKSSKTPYSVACWLVGWLVGWSIGRLVGRSVGRWVGWSVGWLGGWLGGWLVILFGSSVWLVGRVGWLFSSVCRIRLLLRFDFVGVLLVKKSVGIFFFFALRGSVGCLFRLAYFVDGVHKKTKQNKNRTGSAAVVGNETTRTQKKGTALRVSTRNVSCQY